MPTKEQILAGLKTIGVEITGTYGDHRRWSVSDLATDLAHVLAESDRAVIAPIVHMNGDRASTLITNLEHGYDGCRAALEALRECAGNARNFYPDPGRWERYCGQHRERQLHIQAVMESLLAELDAIHEQPETQAQVAKEHAWK